MRRQAGDEPCWNDWCISETALSSSTRPLAFLKQIQRLHFHRCSWLHVCFKHSSRSTPLLGGGGRNLTHIELFLLLNVSHVSENMSLLTHYGYFFPFFFFYLLLTPLSNTFKEKKILCISVSLVYPLPWNEWMNECKPGFCRFVVHAGCICCGYS